jgi:hypothetical protein
MDSTAPAQRRYTVLLVSVFLFLLAYPFAEGEPFARVLFEGFLGIVLVAAVLSVGDTRARLWVGLALGLPALVVRWVATAYVRDTTPDAVGYVMLALFFAYVTIRILRHVLAQSEVDFEAVAGALCAYLFIGFSWACLYALLEDVQPGALTFASGEVQQLLPSCIYYSFVTLTTLGYGDVTPGTTPGQYLSFVEAIIGQFFLAVLVARLVGLQIAQSLDRRS